MRHHVETTHVQRFGLPDAVDDRLFFAQVREDPALELEVLGDCLDETIAVVGSGGCTALSLVASGAKHVVAVDLNRTQNHLVELKAAALAGGDHRQTLAFLGATKAAPEERRAAYRTYRTGLGAGARHYWDARPKNIAEGVLNVGATERLIAAVVWSIRHFAHSRRHVERLLICASLDEQRAFYRETWNNRRWRLLFHVLCNRMVLRKAYDPAFFEHVDNPSFARHFLRTTEHALTELPIGDNYFFHHMFLGYYRTELGGGLPPYLAPRHTAAMTGVAQRLTLVDGTFLAYLRDRAEGSIAGFSLSNICEWLTPAQTAELFGEIVRTARPGATLCLRNFLGWTEVPERWRGVVQEDRALGERLISRDRSMMQARFVACTIRK